MSRLRRFFRAVKEFFSPSKPGPVPAPEPVVTPCLVDELCDDHDTDYSNPDKPEVCDWVPEIYRAEYLHLWETMKYPVLRSGVNAGRRREQTAGSLQWSINFVQRGIHRYKRAAQMIKDELGSNVPWQLIGCLHLREAGGYTGDPFSRNLMNGQPINRVTTWVPRGFGPWDSFEASCVDAFRIKSLPPCWSIENTLYFVERYNGMGYRVESRRRTVGFSPYLFAYSNHYLGGYFVADHQFDSRAVALGVGVAVLLKELGFDGE